MLVLIIIGGLLIVGYEAIKHYNAEKYANKKVYGKNTLFIDFIFSNHPILTGIILFIAVALILGAILSL